MRAVAIGPGLLLLAMVAMPEAAAAQGASGADCSLSVTPLAFGKYTPSSGTPTDFSATITVTCIAAGTAPVPVSGTVTLSGSSGGPARRRLVAGARSLRYQLYLDPAHTTLWRDGPGRGMPVSGVVGPNQVFRQTLTVYGRILARQTDAAVGGYTDQITAMLNY